MIRFADLARQHESLRPEIEAGISRILASGEFVLGKTVTAFEKDFAAYCGADFGIGVNSGTSALHIALLAARVGPGDEVITSPFTFMATAAAIRYTGALPRFADIDPKTFTLDPARIEAAITPRTRAIIPVHLYGHPADMDPILDLAARRGLIVIEDASQAHGALYKGLRVGGIGDMGCFSFYPSKNLGACGEGGIIVTNRHDLAERARPLRDWGDPGFNCRMDGIQGAVLGVKLSRLEQWNATRRQHAARYCEALEDDGLIPPASEPWAEHVFHIFAVRSADRDATRAELRERGIETRIHYDTPLHLLPRFADLGYSPGDFPHAERAAREVLSIPVHPELRAVDVETVVEALRLCQMQTS